MYSTPQWATPSTEVSISLSLRECVCTGDSNWGIFHLYVVAKARAWGKTPEREEETMRFRVGNISTEELRERGSYVCTHTHAHTHTDLSSKNGMRRTRNVCHTDMRGGHSLGKKVIDYQLFQSREGQ